MATVQAAQNKDLHLVILEMKWNKNQSLKSFILEFPGTIDSHKNA